MNLRRDLNEALNRFIRMWCEDDPSVTLETVLNALEDAKTDAPVMWAQAQEETSA